MNRAAPITAACLFVSIVIVATLVSSRTTEPQSAFVPGGAGASALVAEAAREGYDVFRLLSGPALLETGAVGQPAKTLLVILAPQTGYTQAEVDAARAFLDAGGRILVADNFGQANSLTSTLGVVFERVRLVEPGSNQTAVTIDRDTYRITANAPTAVRPSPGHAALVLGNSTTNSFLDRNGDGIVTAGDPPGPFSTALLVDMGPAGGRLLALADPSVFQTGATKSLDDQAFRSQVLALLLPQGGTILVDESRTSTPDPWLAAAATTVSATQREPWRWAFVALAATTLLLALRGSGEDAWRPHRWVMDHFVRREKLRSLLQEEAATNVPRAPTIRWTRRGSVAAFGGLAMLVAGLVFNSPQATYFAAFLLAACVLAIMTSPITVRSVRKLSTHRTDEEGQVRVQLSLSNRGAGAGTLEVREDLPAEFELVEGNNWVEITLPRRAETTIEYACRAHLRGPYHVGPTHLRNSDRFQLRAFESRQGVGNPVHVRPRNHSLDRIPFRSKIPQLTLGPHLVNRAGDGMEFHALRPYQTGDSIRIVNWKASARSKDLVVNQRVHESMATLYVFIDARSVADAGTRHASPLNEACRAAISIASGALKARDKCRIFVYGEGIHEIPEGPGPHDSNEIADALASVAARGATPFRDALRDVLPGLKTKSPIILLSGFESDPTVVDGLLEARHRGFLPAAIAMAISTAPTGKDQGPPEMAGDRLQRAREGSIQELHAGGIPVVPGVPGLPLPMLLRYGVH